MTYSQNPKNMLAMKLSGSRKWDTRPVVKPDTERAQPFCHTENRGWKLSKLQSYCVCACVLHVLYTCMICKHVFLEKPGNNKNYDANSFLCFSQRFKSCCCCCFYCLIFYLENVNSVCFKISNNHLDKLTYLVARFFPHFGSDCFHLRGFHQINGIILTELCVYVAVQGLTIILIK